MYFKAFFFSIVLVFSFLIVNTINDYKIDNLETKKTLVNDKKRISSNTSINWDIPKNWQEIPGNDFSLAVYKIIDIESNTEVSITQFPGRAGGIENNVNRWRRQIGLAALNENEILDDAIVNYNELGKYTVHKIFNIEKPELAFMGMILFLEDNALFIKLKTTINDLPKIEPFFLKFCKSLRI
ncbi:MAG: hypothetical protein CMG07_02340 [Candidatus Marinimicrobia bacterium]|nr:hypothetical protein [Candidatus Neomarinimicrobiota bacterium]